jgi:sortase A
VSDTLPPSSGERLTAPSVQTERGGEPLPPPVAGTRRGRRARRRDRVRKFDRPSPPHDWRWWVSGIGKTLIATGLLMFGFVAYQLWGTGLETARAQRALEGQFEALLAETPAPPTTTPPTTPPPTTAPVEEDPPQTVPEPVTEPDAEPQRSAVPVADQNLPVFSEGFAEGDPIARIEIPAIGVNEIVVAGVGKSDLKKGPGHYPETPIPGQLGNAAIAGHRTTYGQPFFDVDELVDGDEIVVTTTAGRFVYRVTGLQIVTPADYQVIATTDPTAATITLTSCHPKWTARERIIVSGELDTEASDPVGEALINYGRPLDGAVDTDPGPGPELDSDSDSDSDTDTDTDTDTGTGTGSEDEDTPPSTEQSGTATDTGTDPDPADGAETGPGSPTDPDLGGDGVTGSADLENDQLNAGIADAFAEGWFSDPGANSQVALWGVLLAAIGILSYLVSRRFRRDWVGAMVGVIPFMVTLYFFFQNVNRLLPPNL